MIEKTPIDIYRESRVKSIYIELSRNYRAANSYALQIRGLISLNLIEIVHFV